MDSISVVDVIGFCLVIGIASVAASDYLAKLAQKHNLKITPRMFQIFGFVIIVCNLVQLMLLMLNPSSSASESSSNSSDVQYRNDDAGYTVIFSGTPQETTQQQPVGNSTMALHLTQLRIENPRRTYGVMYTDTGQGAMTDDFESGMLHAITPRLGDLQSKKQISVDGVTGEEYVFRPGNAFIRIRIFSHSDRIYVVLDGGPEDLEDAYTDLHFADSFHFTQ